MSNRFAHQRSERVRSAFTVVELLVVIAIIGVLVSILLPAVQAARLRSLQNANLNNVRQVTLAILQYEQSKKTLPPLIHRYGPKPAPAKMMKPDLTKTVSWAFVILPYLEAQNQYDRLDVTKEYFDPSNQVAIGTPVEMYANPIRRDAVGTAPFMMTVSAGLQMGASLDYAANGGVIVKPNTQAITLPSPVKLPSDVSSITEDFPYREKFHTRYSGPFHTDVDFGIPIAAVKDGLTNTICIGDRWQGPPTPGSHMTWNDLAGFPGDSYPTLIRYANGDDTSALALPFPISKDDPSVLKFGGTRDSSACFGFLDGRAKYLQYSIDPVVFQRLAAINDGEIVGEID